MRVRYLTIEEVVLFHSAAIQEYGGTHGIRDVTLAQSATIRPRQIFSGKELYSAIWLKAAALFHSLAMDHAFVDGNKRTAITCAVIFLRHNGWRLKVPHDKLFEFVIKVVTQHIDIEAIAEWLQAHSEKA